MTSNEKLKKDWIRCQNCKHIQRYGEACEYCGHCLAKNIEIEELEQRIQVGEQSYEEVKNKAPVEGPRTTRKNPRFSLNKEAKLWAIFCVVIALFVLTYTSVELAKSRAVETEMHPYDIAMTSKDSAEIRVAIKALYEEFAAFAAQYSLAPQSVIKVGDNTVVGLKDIEKRCRLIVNDLKFINADDEMMNNWHVCVADCLVYQAKVYQEQIAMVKTDVVIKTIKEKIRRVKQYEDYR